jgi:hypothetical protein
VRHEKESERVDVEQNYIRSWHVHDRHFIKLSLNPRFLSQMASYDVASNICWALS